MERFTVRIVFDRKGETKNNPQKEALVHIEVVERSTKKKKYISTSVRIFANQYSTNGGFSIKSHPNSIILKSAVNLIYNQVEAFVFSGKCQSIDDVENWNKVESKKASMTFLEFYEDMMKKHATTMWVLQNWQSLLTRLEEFGKIIHFKDLTYTNIADFDLFLRKTITSQPVIYKRHQLLKRVIVEANKRKVTDMNPYDDFPFKKGKSADPVSLEFDELIKIEAWQPNTKSMERIKDMYLFQCYTGLAYIDMQKFNAEELVHLVDHIVIKSSRRKTDERYVTLFHDKIKDIVKKYGYKFPKMSNSNYNQYLKVMATHAGVNKHITSHSARHTAATVVFLANNVSLENVSKILGHSSTKMTQHYAKVLDSSILRDMQQVEAKFG